MADIDPISAPSDFDQTQVQILDWAINPRTGTRMNNRQVRNRRGLYSIANGDLIINDPGPPVMLRKCSMNDYETNFLQDDALLCARDPSAATMPNSTPLLLAFDQPLRAVGTYVSVSGDKSLQGLHLNALMWVQLTDNDEWFRVSSDGECSTVLSAGAPPTAPFLGAIAVPTKGIRKVCFDASLMGRFETLAVSKLFWIGM